MAGALLVGLFLWFLIAVVGAALYFLPTIVAVAQHRTNVVAVALINVFLGWSLIGWVVALVMALSREPQPVQIVHVQQQMGYMPTGYQQPAPSYGQIRQVPGSQIQPVNPPPAPGSQLDQSQPPNASP